MSDCPHCDTQLTAAERAGDGCPACGRSLTRLSPDTRATLHPRSVGLVLAGVGAALIGLCIGLPMLFVLLDGGEATFWIKGALLGWVLLVGGLAAVVLGERMVDFVPTGHEPLNFKSTVGLLVLLATTLGGWLLLHRLLKALGFVLAR